MLPCGMTLPVAGVIAIGSAIAIGMAVGMAVGVAVDRRLWHRAHLRD